MTTGIDNRTIGDLRLQLADKDYQEYQTSLEQLETLPLITVHTHPLITNPVVLIGENLTPALNYQKQQVDAAIKRR